MANTTDSRGGSITGRPESSEAASYYFRYIDRVAGGDVLGAMETQAQEMAGFLAGISEEKSLDRYAPGKWSVRQVLNHVNDCERVFFHRAFWFARRLGPSLPGFDEGPCAEVARADECSWVSHVDDFRDTRRASLAFFRNLPADCWSNAGTASDNPFTVRALAYVIVGHASHHAEVLREKYGVRADPRSEV